LALRRACLRAIPAPTTTVVRMGASRGGIGVNPRISTPFRELVPEMRGIEGDGSSFPPEGEAARLQGAFVDGARRIRTADLLGAIQVSRAAGKVKKDL
jgi:hypothetical protein